MLHTRIKFYDKMTKFRHEDFLHENEILCMKICIFMHENYIVIYENEIIMPPG